MVDEFHLAFQDRLQVIQDLILHIGHHLGGPFDTCKDLVSALAFCWNSLMVYSGIGNQRRTMNL